MDWNNHQQMADELYHEKVLRARRMSPPESILAGQELFEAACRVTKAGIRHQHPEFTEEEVLAGLKRRLKIQERLENRHAC